ncbi:unnamed protein product, partial [Polarella glacialis]
VFAISFGLWRRHLASALPRRQPQGATSAAAVAATGNKPQDLNAPAAVDEELERLAVQVLAVYQDPQVAQSCLTVLVQVGNADPWTLLQVMGKAARRVDIGAAYASSAIFVLVAFVQRSPGKVLPLLTRFTEAVLRCLEPSDPTLRRHSLMAVTSALHELVNTFPMVDFHQQSQKFAVGTSDGRVVVYDLRTATKWRILEGHTGAVAGLAFAGDGNRLSSYSANDCSVRVWQTGSEGFLGGLLGSGKRCLKTQVLPPIDLLSGTSNGWRNVTLKWSDQGLKLVRENGDNLRIGID